MAIGKLSMKATDMIAISCASIVKCCNGFSKSKFPPLLDRFEAYDWSVLGSRLKIKEKAITFLEASKIGGLHRNKYSRRHKRVLYIAF